MALDLTTRFLARRALIPVVIVVTTLAVYVLSTEAFPSLHVAEHVRSDLYLGLAAVYASSFAALATAMAVVFALAPGDRLSAVIDFHGRELVDSLAGDAGGLFLSSSGSLGALALDGIGFDRVAASLGWGIAVGGFLFTAHFGLTLVRILRIAVLDQTDPD